MCTFLVSTVYFINAVISNDDNFEKEYSCLYNYVFYFKIKIKFIQVQHKKNVHKRNGNEATRDWRWSDCTNQSSIILLLIWHNAMMIYSEKSEWINRWSDDIVFVFMLPRLRWLNGKSSIAHRSWRLFWHGNRQQKSRAYTE